MTKFLIELRHLKTMLPHLMRAELIYRAIHKRILNTPDFKAILQKNSTVQIKGSGHTGRKYLKIPIYFRENIIRALMLGLDKKTEARIFDLGCGPGYFFVGLPLFGSRSSGVRCSR